MNKQISKKLLEAAKDRNPEALFQLGISTLKSKQVGFAWLCLTQAADLGHPDARMCMHGFSQAAFSVTKWREKILSDYIKTVHG